MVSNRIEKWPKRNFLLKAFRVRKKENQLVFLLPLERAAIRL